MNEIQLNMQHAVTSGKISAFAYDRISSFTQEDGLSLQQQEKGGLAYADRSGLEVVKSFTVIESAYKEGRKVFGQMLDLALQYNVKHLIFKNTDRLSRNLHDLIRIRDLIEKNGIHIHFYEMGQVIHTESSYDEKWVIELLILIAKRHSDKLSHDVKAVYKYKAEKGIPPHKPPIGYIYDKELKQVKIDKRYENTIRFIFDEFDSGPYSIQEFADQLNDKGYKTSNGRRWSKGNLHALLTDTFYHGEFVFRGDICPGKYETYYNKSRWQSRMNRLGIRNVGKRKHNRNYIFSGMIRCDDCGCVLTGDTKKEKYIYYGHKCQDRKSVYYQESRVIEYFDSEISDLVFSEEYASFLKDMFSESVEIKSKSQSGDLLSITRKISASEIKQGKLLDLYFEGALPKEALQRKMDECQKEIDILEKQRKSLRVDKNQFIFNVINLIDQLRAFPAIYADSGFEDKGRLIKNMVKSVKISGTGMDIEWQQPFNFLLKHKLLRLKDAGVRDCLLRLPQIDDFRTDIDGAIFDLVLYYAA